MFPKTLSTPVPIGEPWLPHRPDDLVLVHGPHGREQPVDLLDLAPPRMCSSARCTPSRSWARPCRGSPATSSWPRTSSHAGALQRDTGAEEPEVVESVGLRTTVHRTRKESTSLNLKARV